MPSCAFLILEAATISIALVIFRVFCTLRIFILISLVPGIRSYRFFFQSSMAVFRAFSSSAERSFLSSMVFTSEAYLPFT